LRTIAVSPSPQQSVKRNGLAARTSLTDSQKWLASRLQTFARIFGLHADPKGGHFAPARINDTLTLLFGKRQADTV
jgi:hypothetical protein